MTGGGTDDLTLTLGEVRTPFASLASGMVLAFLALVAEYAYRVCCCIRPGPDQVYARYCLKAIQISAVLLENSRR